MKKEMEFKLDTIERQLEDITERIESMEWKRHRPIFDRKAAIIFLTVLAVSLEIAKISMLIMLLNR